MKVAVITGGTKGIGKALCLKFLSEGFRVYTSARNIDKTFNHVNLRMMQTDLSIKENVLKFGNWVKDQEKAIDVLINNVGVYIPGSLMDEDENSFETQINTNLASTYHLTRSCISHIKLSPNAYIFNICSTASITPYMNGGSYCISKYAQLGFTKVLREELKADKIKVSAVLPGATYTNSWEGSDLPLDRFIKPESIAQIIWTTYDLKDSIVLEEILVRPMDGDIT